MRTLKALGIALMAALAMSAVVAAAAQAKDTGNFTEANGEYPAHLTGEDEAGKLNAFTTPGVSADAAVECSEATYTGELEKEAFEVTITPTYHGCENQEGRDVTVTTNGCAYIFDGNGTVDIECPDGKEIEVHVYSFFDPNHEGTPVCTVKVPEEGNQNLHKVTYTNEEGKVTVEGTVEEITYTWEGLCGSGEASDGVYHVNVIVESAGKSIDVG